MNQLLGCSYPNFRGISVDLQPLDMTLRLLRPVVVNGHDGLKVGSIFETEDHKARHLIAEGLAEVVEAKPEPVSIAIERRDPEIQNRDPQTQPAQSSRRKLPK